MAIVRGTTPKITFTFQTVDVTDISTAYLVLKQWGEAKITKDITTATADTEAGTLSWTLTQTESLTLETAKKCTIMCDWLTSSGTRGRSVEKNESVEDPGKNEVIS